MSKNLKNFWRLLERRYDCIAIMPEWKLALGDDALQSFRHRYLMPQAEFATYYPNPNDPRGPNYDVIAYRNGTFEAASRSREHCFSLKTEDVVFYRWNLPLFHNDVAQKLNVEPSSETVKTGDRTIRLGNYHLSPGEECPVYWLLANDISEFRRDVPPLMFKVKTPFFLFTGTRNVWDSEIQNVLSENNTPLLALSEVLEFDCGQFVPTDVWQGAVEVLRKTLQPEKSVEKPDFMLVKRGAWVFRFNEKETIADTNWPGPVFVQFLLRNPDIEFHVEKLWQAVMGTPSTGRFEHAFADEGTEIPDSLLGGADEILDAEAKMAYETRLKELVGERKTAEADKDEAAMQRINEEYETIRDALESAGGGIHQPKKLGDPVVRLRDRIRWGINVFIDHVSKNDSEGGQYLKNTITRGTFMKYSPSREIDWILS